VVDVTRKRPPSVWYELYMKERERLAKVCALRAGIEERKVKLAESQGVLVADIIRLIFNALGLSQSSRPWCRRSCPMNCGHLQQDSRPEPDG
jgi:hypothetical protein